MTLVTAIPWIQPLAQELRHAAGMVKKQTNKQTKKTVHIKVIQDIGEDFQCQEDELDELAVISVTKLKPLGCI